MTLLWSMLVVGAVGLPLSSIMRIPIKSRNDSHVPMEYGVESYGRAIYAAISLLCMFGLAVMIGMYMLLNV